jgi:hypothetical protein
MNRSLYWSTSTVTLLIVFAFPALLFSQDRTIEYGLSTSAYAATSSAELSFWLYANTGGVVEPQSSNFINNLYGRYQYQNSDQSLRLTTGIDLAARVSNENKLFIKELYGSVGYGFVNVTAGRFYQSIGLTDDDLTMGSMQVSRNAIPVPRVQLSTDGFTDIPFTDGYVQFKSMLAHGWLEEDRYVSNAYLHQKYFYLKVNYKMFEGMGGIIHNVVWGGNHPTLGPLPSSFNDYLRVLFGQSASPNSQAPGSDISNAIGNSVAAYDFRLNVNLDKFQLKAYRMFYLEDKVSTRFRSPWDGMWGAGIEFSDQNKIVNEILWEHLNTKRQDSFDFEPRGTASYYHNGIYRSGWAYEGRVLGNPLILYGPNSNFLQRGNISNNIIIAHHIGIEGRPTDRLHYKAFVTYSRNYGTVEDQTQQTPNIPISELRIDEYSALLNADYLIAPSSGLRLTGSLAFDIGKLYGHNRLGFQIGLRWNQIVK